MDKKYLVIFIIISLIILCKNSRKEKFSTTSATDNQVQAIGNISNWLSTNDCHINKVGIPNGTIVMWSGAKSDIPAYWHICNGAQRSGTPDLTNKFILGADHTKNDGDSKINSNSPDKKLTKEMIPVMTTSSGGSHNHKYDKASQSSYTRGWGARCSSTDCSNNKGGHPLSNSSTDSTSTGAHTHTVGTAAASQENIPIPRHHSLYFIMKVSFYTDGGESATAPGPSGCTQSA
jgi:hypothetical protein